MENPSVALRAALRPMAADDLFDSTQEVTIAADRDLLLRQQAAPTGSAIVIVLRGANVGQRLQLGEETCTIGRGSSAQLVLESDAISRSHARIEWRDGGHYLVDLGSTNGSFVNYAKVDTRRLTDEDEIQIGDVLLKYLSGSNIETAYHEEFRKLVRQDALTGALNRPTFDEELRVALRRALQKPGLSLVLFDLDHFKQVNDTWGHTAGDLVLREVGSAVLGLLEKPHQFARVGGEEFAVIFVGSGEAARALAEALRVSIAALAIRYEGTTLTVTASFGIARAEVGDETTTPAGLYEAADKKLYEAKENGRNRVAV